MSVQAPARRQIDAIQGMRAFAALLVALGHMLHEVSGMRGAAALPGLFQNWTGAGVDIFFVISGFVMVYASQRLFAQPGGAQVFLHRRIARIVPLYWAMTTVFLLAMAAVPSAIASTAPAPIEILKSYFFIPYVRPDQDYMQPVYKLGWTLNYEMYFYCVFACVIVLPVRRAVVAMAALFFAVVLAGQLFTPQPGVLQFWSHPIILEFIWGAGIALLALRGFALPGVAAWGLIGMGLSGFALWAVSGVDPYGALRPLVWGVPAAAMVAGAAFMPHGGNGPLSRLMVLLGDASYAIYLVHPMVIRGLRLVWDKTGMPVTMPGVIYIIVAMIVTIGASLLVYSWFEKPLTAALQRR